MDKDLVILKHEQNEIEELDNDISVLDESSSDQDARLQEMQKRIDDMYRRMGKSQTVEAPGFVVSERQLDPTISREELSYDELYILAEESLKSRGLEVDSIGFDDLLDDREMMELLEELDAPLPRDYKWKKSDFIVVFIAGLLGSVVDFILSNRENSFTGKASKFSKNLNEIHERIAPHKPGAPIDFQGKIDGFSFGGGAHRELSKGHDLLRFVEGIRMFKNGTFEAVAYENGVKHVVRTAFNQYGKPYEELPLIGAIVEYARHMFADLFSSNSLPFPGYSFLRESNNRDIRKFSTDMYQNGFNCKNVLTQSVTAVIVEIIIRLYFSIQSVREYRNSIDVKEDYSNWEAVKAFAKPMCQEKLHEMILVSHSIVLALNIGKIIITERVEQINVAEIIAVVKYGIKVTKAVAKRNSEYARIVYHATEVNKRWDDLEAEIVPYDDLLIEEMSETLVIA